MDGDNLDALIVVISCSLMAREDKSTYDERGLSWLGGWLYNIEWNPCSNSSPQNQKHRRGWTFGVALDSNCCLISSWLAAAILLGLTAAALNDCGGFSCSLGVVCPEFVAVFELAGVGFGRAVGEWFTCILTNGLAESYNLLGRTCWPLTLAKPLATKVLTLDLLCDAAAPSMGILLWIS